MSDYTRSNKEVASAAIFTVDSSDLPTRVSTSNPLPQAPVVAGAVVATANPLPTVTTVGGAVVSATNALATAPVVAGAVVSTANPLPTTVGAPAAANVVVGYQTFAATTGATTLLTVAAGRTWSGMIGASCAVDVAAASSTAGQARAVFATAGTGVTPAAGTILAVEAKAGANAATGTVGSNNSARASVPFTIVAPVGNAVTVTVATTQAGTSSIVDAFASGVYVA